MADGMAYAHEEQGLGAWGFPKETLRDMEEDVLPLCCDGREPAEAFRFSPIGVQVPEAVVFITRKVGPNYDELYSAVVVFFGEEKCELYGGISPPGSNIAEKAYEFAAQAYEDRGYTQTVAKNLLERWSGGHKNA